MLLTFGALYSVNYLLSWPKTVFGEVLNLTENHSPTEVLYYSFIDWYYFIHLKKNKEKILNGPIIGAPQDVLQKPLPGLFLEIL